MPVLCVWRENGESMGLNGSIGLITHEIQATAHGLEHHPYAQLQHIVQIRLGAHSTLSVWKEQPPSHNGKCTSVKLQQCSPGYIRSHSSHLLQHHYLPASRCRGSPVNDNNILFKAVNRFIIQPDCWSNRPRSLWNCVKINVNIAK